LLEQRHRVGEAVGDFTVLQVQQAVAQVQQGGLAAAGGADQRADLAGRQGEGNVGQHRGAHETVRQLADLKTWMAHQDGSRQRSTSRLSGSSNRYSMASS